MKIIKQIPLNSCEENLYTGAVYIGNSYKILAPKLNQIDLFTCKLNKVCSKKTCNKYTSITTAKNKNEFFVAKENDINNIYLIDDKYNEIGLIELKVPNIYKKKIKSISFNNEECKIYICTEIMVYSVTIHGDFIKEELSKETINKIKTNTIIIKNRCANQRSSMVKLTCASYICGKLAIGYKKNKSLYISEISRSGNIINTNFIDDDIIVNEIFPVKGKVELLITKQDKYSYIYLTDSCCIKDSCKNKCEVMCPNECSTNKKCEKNNKTKECNLCEIIESIALIETALAHILNAEGEKIQKAVKIACNCNDLICVNDSVAKTITNITMLEQILTEKLSISLKEKNKQ